MDIDQLLEDLRTLYEHRAGLDATSGPAWLSKVIVLVESVDPDRAMAMKTASSVFTMPVSIDMRETGWQTVVQNLREVIAKLEIGGYSIIGEPGNSEPPNSSRVFIGHGRSNEWRKLKDFITDRLELEFEEFNREPGAGYSTKERLEAMLDSSSFAFLVMTGEDVEVDGPPRARENVVHEVDLFQGRHGFNRAIVLLEEGCNEFSNIEGLIQLRFPPGDIWSSPGFVDG